MYNKLLALLTLLQIATRPISVSAAVAILVFQYIVMPLLGLKLKVPVQYMSDVVACALVGKVIAYIAGRSVEKIRGVASVRES